MLRQGSRRRLAVAAVAGLTASSLALSSCGGSSDKQPKVSRSITHGVAPVAGPNAQDAILPPQSVAAPSASHPVQRPNILMITVDDAAQGDMPYMPHLQKLLATQGVTLTQGIAPTPICVPARASLLTGEYAHNHGAVTIAGQGGGFKSFPDSDTLPVWLSRAGYDTNFVGKYLNGYVQEGSGCYVPPGWNDWQATIDPSTYNYAKPVVCDNGTPVPHQEYSTDLLSQISDQRIQAEAAAKKPWFMWVNYVAPHFGGPIDPGDPKGFKTASPAPEFQGKYAGLPLPNKPNIFEQDMSDKVILPKPVIRLDVTDRVRAAFASVRQQRIEALQSVDQALVSTFHTLRSTGQLKNTYVVFTSDNGYAVGEHRIDGKLWYFTEIADIPMYIRGPGIPRGVSSDLPVTNADWAPTLADLAGVPAGPKVDGVDVLGWLQHDPASAPGRRVVPIEGYKVAGGLRPQYTGVIVGPWTYVHGRHRGQMELYYRRVDPYQLNNLAGDPRYRTYLRQLKKLTRQTKHCATTSCPHDFYVGSVTQ